MTRHLIVVDCESTGLRSEDIAVEVAWHNLATDDRGCFIPPHDTAWVLEFGQPIALEMNGYRDRILGQPHASPAEIHHLFDQLTGSTIVGSNPTADAAWLEQMFVDHVKLDDVTTMPRPWAPWHHRMWDIGAYAAGVLGLDYVPGLWTVCEALGIEPNNHTATDDVTATGLVFRALQDRAGAL